MAGLEQLLIGRTLDGRYDVEEVLGTGRSGSVYRARHNRLGSEVAIKVVSAPRKAETRERYRRLFRREAALAAGLRHPNLPLVIGSGTDPETDLDFFVTELLEGERLSQVLAQRGRPPAALALRVFADAVAGVAAAHAVGMLHRDLRPANLYLVRVPGEKQKRVRVLGFGVPQIVRRDTMTSTEMELIGYSPPELFAGGRLTPASDVFGIGAIGWQLLVGSLPYDDAARRDLAVGRPVALRVPPELDAVPPHVAEAIVRALRPDPAERFADVAAFAAALDGRAEPEPAPAAEPAAAEPFAAAPIIVATQPAPVAAPVEAAPIIVAAEPAPIAAPVEAAPIIVAAEPAPVAAPVEAASIAVATEPAPVAEPVDAAPVVAAAVVAAVPVVAIAAEAAAPVEIAEPEIVAAADAAPAPVEPVAIEDAAPATPAFIAAEGSFLESESEPPVAEEPVEQADSAPAADLASADALPVAAVAHASDVAAAEEPIEPVAEIEPDAAPIEPAVAVEEIASPAAEPYRPPPPPKRGAASGLELYYPPEAPLATPAEPVPAPAPVPVPTAVSPDTTLFFARLAEPDEPEIETSAAQPEPQSALEAPIAPQPAAVQMSFGMADAAPSVEPEPLATHAVASESPRLVEEADAHEDGPLPMLVMPGPATTDVRPVAAPVITERRLRFAQPRNPRPSIRPMLAAAVVLGLLAAGSAAYVITQRAAPTADGGAAAAGASQLAAATAPATDQPAAAADSAAPAPVVARTPVQPLPAPVTPGEQPAQPTAAERAALAREAQQKAAAPQQPATQPTPAPAPAQTAAAQRPIAAPPAAPPPAPAAPQPQSQPAPREQLAASAAETSRPPAPEVYDVSHVEQRPTLVNAPEVARTLQNRYPRQLQQNRVEGRVTATFVVREDGSVDPSSIRVLNSPNAAFNMPTAAVLRRARFTPARVNGEAVKVQVTMPVSWTVN